MGTCNFFPQAILDTKAQWLYESVGCSDLISLGETGPVAEQDAIPGWGAWSHCKGVWELRTSVPVPPFFRAHPPCAQCCWKSVDIRATYTCEPLFLLGRAQPPVQMVICFVKFIKRRVKTLSSFCSNFLSPSHFSSISCDLRLFFLSFFLFYIHWKWSSVGSMFSFGLLVYFSVVFSYST
jgi:hypothetical protein